MEKCKPGARKQLNEHFPSSLLPHASLVLLPRPQQLRLDVAEFGQETMRLGVDVSATPPYERLLEVVEAKDKDPASPASGGLTSPR